MITSPFKFLDSYTKDDALIFFGREKETEELYRKIFENKTLLVYGVSGTGKTSIINCGLANKFNDADWLPVTIRRNQNMVESFYTALHKLTPDTKDKGKRDAKAFIKLLQSVYLDHFKPVYLLFDQFEELFIFGDEEEQQAFVDIIAQIKASDVQVKILFIMREEYLANMSAFEEKIPDLLTNRLRIEKMSTAKVKEAITGPCNFAEIGIENEAVETIIEKLTRQGKTIELTYLQVLLDRLFHKAAQEQKGDNLQFTQSLVVSLGEVSDILGDFLEEQIRQFDNPDQVLDVLKSFVSIRGTKRQSTVEEIGNHLRSLNKAQETDTLQTTIQQLVNLRILREKDENDRYELRHDALAMKIYEKISQFEKELIEIRYFIENARLNFEKRGKLLTKDDLKYLAPYEDKLYLPMAEQNLLDKSKQYHARMKRRKRMLTGLSATLIIIIAVFYAITSYQKQKAAELRYRISQSKNIAEKALSMLEEDPTMAYCLGEAAWKINHTLEAEKALIKSYRRGPFYDNKLPGKTSKEYLEFKLTLPSNKLPIISPSKKIILVNADTGNNVIICDYKGQKISEIDLDYYPYRRLTYFTKQEQHIVTYEIRKELYTVWTIHGEKLYEHKSDEVLSFRVKNDTVLFTGKDRIEHVVYNGKQISTRNYKNFTKEGLELNSTIDEFQNKKIEYNIEDYYYGSLYAYFKGINQKIRGNDFHEYLIETDSIHNYKITVEADSNIIDKEIFGYQDDLLTGRNQIIDYIFYIDDQPYDTFHLKARRNQSFLFSSDGDFILYSDTIYRIKDKAKIPNSLPLLAPLHNNYYISVNNSGIVIKKFNPDDFQVLCQGVPLHTDKWMRTRRPRSAYLEYYDKFITIVNNKLILYDKFGNENKKRSYNADSYSPYYFTIIENEDWLIDDNEKNKLTISRIKSLEKLKAIKTSTNRQILYDSVKRQFIVATDQNIVYYNNDLDSIGIYALPDTLELKGFSGVTPSNFPYIIVESDSLNYIYNINTTDLFIIRSGSLLGYYKYNIDGTIYHYLKYPNARNKAYVYSENGKLIKEVNAQGGDLHFDIKVFNKKLYYTSCNFFGFTDCNENLSPERISLTRGNEGFIEIYNLTNERKSIVSFINDFDKGGRITRIFRDESFIVDGNPVLFYNQDGILLDKMERNGWNTNIFPITKNEVLYFKNNYQMVTLNFDPDSIIHDVRVKHVYGKVYELTQKEKEEYGIE